MSSKKRVLILGATGRVGQKAVERSFELGMKVSVYVRNGEKAKHLFPSNVEILQGELDQSSKLQDATKGVDGVISTLASYFPPNTQMSTALQAISEAAMTRAVSGENSRKLRLFHFGLCGLQNPDSDLFYLQSFLRISDHISPYKMGKAIEDHRRVLRILRNSPHLNSTIFQTPTMVYDRPLGDYQAGSPTEVPGMKIWDKVGALDAADACLQRLDQEGPQFLNLKY